MPRTVCLLLLALVLTLPARAGESADEEIQFLIQQVAESGCTFVRNGSEHNAADAADHLRLKYRSASRYADSAEHFIDRLATKSSWTGKAYTITCDGVTEPSSAWLHRALEAHRQQPN